MLANYLADIEQLLDEQQWEAALREAFDLPQLAVALDDPQLSTSNERVKAWCHQWIRPQDPDLNARGSDYERVSEVVYQRALQTESTASDTVPSRALRRLRLRRLVRTPARGFNSARACALAPEGTDAVEICTILVEAARRWYAQSACHDPTVQANLARLAVLR
ncbi:MAG: hypothetical protein JWN85_505 [Gammaproteobacteria bacterium]|nr:hypothetical protein [Gammaproteobacteria bacterium]